MKRLFAAILLTICAAFPAFAGLTSGQLATLKSAILADPVLGQLPLVNGAFPQAAAEQAAAAFNAPASPAFTVWRTSVNPDEIMRNGMDWARIDNLSVGKARIWEWMTKLGTFDCSRPNIRAGIDSVWVGTAADLAVRATVYAHCKRPATRGEKLFATGTGSDADPATMVIEGAIDWQDVQRARELP